MPELPVDIKQSIDPGIFTENSSNTFLLVNKNLKSPRPRTTMAKAERDFAEF